MKGAIDARRATPTAARTRLATFQRRQRKLLLPHPHNRASSADAPRLLVRFEPLSSEALNLDKKTTVNSTAVSTPEDVSCHPNSSTSS